MEEREERYDLDFAAEETPMTDDEVFDAVEQVFGEDERIDATYIEVSVENGVVYLEGMVGTQEEKEMADSLLDDIEGIKTVQNNLQVVQSGFTADNSLAGSGDEEEFEGVEVLPDYKELASEDEADAIEEDKSFMSPNDEKLISEDAADAIGEGKSFVPPNEPVFPTERGDAAERMRSRRAEEESTGKTKEPY